MLRIYFFRIKIGKGALVGLEITDDLWEDRTAWRPRIHVVDPDNIRNKLPRWWWSMIWAPKQIAVGCITLPSIKIEGCDQIYDRCRLNPVSAYAAAKATLLNSFKERSINLMIFLQQFFITSEECTNKKLYFIIIQSFFYTWYVGNMLVTSR